MADLVDQSRMQESAKNKSVPFFPIGGRDNYFDNRRLSTLTRSP